MIQNLQRKVSIALGLIVVVLALLLQKSCERTGDIKQNLLASEIKVETWKDKDGRSHAKTRQLESSIEALEITHKDELDSLTLLIKGLKIKNIQSVISTKAEVKDVVQAPIDSVGGFKYTDGFTFITGSVFEDSIKLSYRIGVPLKLVSYKAKEKFLSFRKVSYVEAVSENPNVYFTGISKIKVSNSRRKIGLGFNFSYGVSQTGLGFHLGFGLQYRIF